MSKSKPRPDETHRPISKKRRIQRALHKQQFDRDMQFFPQPDPPLFKPLG